MGKCSAGRHLLSVLGPDVFLLGKDGKEPSIVVYLPNKHAEKVKKKSQHLDQGMFGSRRPKSVSLVGLEAGPRVKPALIWKPYTIRVNPVCVDNKGITSDQL